MSKSMLIQGRACLPEECILFSFFRFKVIKIFWQFVVVVIPVLLSFLLEKTGGLFKRRLETLGLFISRA